MEEQLNALKDTVNVKKMVYFFAKSNEMIVSKYSYGHQIGQWSDIRKNFLPKDFDNIKKIFINNVNAYRPTNELKNNDEDATSEQLNDLYINDPPISDEVHDEIDQKT